MYNTNGHISAGRRHASHHVRPTRPDIITYYTNRCVFTCRKPSQTTAAPAGHPTCTNDVFWHVFMCRQHLTYVYDVFRCVFTRVRNPLDTTQTTEQGPRPSHLPNNMSPSCVAQTDVSLHALNMPCPTSDPHVENSCRVSVDPPYRLSTFSHHSLSNSATSDPLGQVLTCPAVLQPPCCVFHNSTHILTSKIIPNH